MTASYSTTDVMAVALARELRDGEVVVMGAVPALPLLACRLARSLHAPSLNYVVGGSGAVNPQLPVLTTQSCDPRLVGGPCALPLPEVVLLEGRGDVFDVFCAGGLQIDARGNCNLVRVGEDPETGRLRLASVHPGVPVAEVQAQTGFELVAPAAVPETPPPTEAELAELRRLDPTEVLAA
jgi:glutaconate CoA-transferase subunit B